MRLDLKHKQLAICKEVSSLVKDVYLITKLLPDDKKFNMVSQMRRAALSVKLNLAEGASRRSVLERNRFYEISRGSIVEIDAALETAIDLDYLSITHLEKLRIQLNKCFAMISKMIK